MRRASRARTSPRTLGRQHPAADIPRIRSPRMWSGSECWLPNSKLPVLKNSVDSDYARTLSDTRSPHSHELCTWTLAFAAPPACDTSAFVLRSAAVRHTASTQDLGGPL